MSKKKLSVTTPSDREATITRVFDAPRDLVWDCWTKPELLKRWLSGMPGWTLAVCEIDLRVGGKYRYVWRQSADGIEMGMGGEFREVVAPERLVNTQLFDQDWTGGEAIGTLVLTETAGVTTSAYTILYASKEARDGAMKTGMADGMELGYQRLDDLLARGPRLRRPGEFCWVNMITPKPAEAMTFFGKLLGWEFFEMPGVGHGLRLGGRDFGGLFDLNGPNTPPGTPAHIGVMVKVENADDTAARVAALGGKALPPFDVFDAGRMAVCFDPNGAGFDVWEPRKMPGTSVDPLLPGAPCWFETLTTDTARASEFYHDLFGWAATTKPSTIPGAAYTEFALDGQPVGGMMPILPHMGEFPPHWAVYFNVTDTDATAKLAADLGGSVCVPPTDIPGVGRFAGITSPQGVNFYVIAIVG